MSELESWHGKQLHPQRLFTLFKWTIYALLVVNAWFFFQEDLGASAETFTEINWRNFVEAFSGFTDTIAWIVLLLVFEFETAIIPDEKLRGGLKYLLAALKALCYVFIVYAFYGYLGKLGLVTDLTLFRIEDVCSLAGGNWNWVVELDEYPQIDAESCVALQGQDLFRVGNLELLGTREAMELSLKLAMTDVINAGTWLIVVAVLEIEVWMQIKDVLTDRTIRLSKYLKGVLYTILFLCAVYWGIDGDFVDFWDAFLWLVAFIFIELNIFQWHEEVEEAHALEVQTESGRSDV